MLPHHPYRSFLNTLLILFALCGPLYAGETNTEAQVIAERICTIPKFVEWPARRFNQPDGPFVIGVFGTDAVTELLRETIQDRRIKDRPVVVRQCLAKEELPACHLVFISHTENYQLDSILRIVRREGVLSIGESDNFLSHGGIINLINISGNIRFQINLDAAKRERLNISSKLLQLALPQNLDVTGGPASVLGFSH